MADELRKCPACSGRGYFRCDCWPGDCICGQDEETCWECEGDGWIDPSYDNLAPDLEMAGPTYLDFITPDEVFDQGPDAVREWQEAKKAEIRSPTPRVAH